jgi:glycosyltransferase 2 family protein
VSKIADTLVRVAGGLLALAGVGWVAWRFARTGVWTQFASSPRSPELAWMVAAAMPVYLGGLCLAALAWWCLQASFLASRPPLKPLFAIYATTQFAKYLPGNVGHYVARHVLLRQQGMGHSALLMATLGEAGFLVLASLAWAAGALSTVAPWLHVQVTGWQLLLGECAFLFAGVAVLRWLHGRSERLSAWLPLRHARWLLPVLPLHLLLFGCMALALILPASVLLTNTQDMWLLPAVAAASWVVGFLVVGAPAGLGVREAVFLVLLHGHLPETDILLLAAVFRIITFGGDILLLLLGLALGGGRLAAEASGNEGSVAGRRRRPLSH